MSIRTVVALLVCGTLCIIGAGCGGSDSSTDSSSATVSAEASLTKAELIKKADSICRKADERQTSELGTYVQKHPKAEKTKSGQEKMVVAVGLPAIQDEIDELAALQPPPKGEIAYDAIVKGVEQALVSATEDPGSVLGSAENPFLNVGRQAAKYGFKDCSEPL